jgi:DNA-binding SARP family transcriptional activator/basic membrane lipoprotein Med (substrate-binding protein (PBP1-ABC) superfamily)
MEYRLLGPLEVAEDGRPVSLGGSRARAVLALLLLHRNQVVAVDWIVDELWAERPPKTGSQVVRVYVSQLRKALEPARSTEPPRILITRRNGYLLRVGPDELDVDRFGTLRAEGHRLLAEGEIADAARTLEEALSLWRGPPLQDFTYEAFAQPEIARLEELRLATLEDLFDAQLAAGRDAELVADLEQLVNANPLRERLRAQLMLAMYRAGRPADALEIYQRGRRLLVEELGLEPGETLRRLETRILQQDSELDRPSVSQPPKETPAQPTASRSRRLAMRSLALALLSAAAIAGILTAATPGHSQKPQRVSLVIDVPRSISDTSPTGIAPLNGLHAAAKETGLRPEVLYSGYTLSSFLRKIRTAARTSNLVIVPAAKNLDAVSKLTRQFPDTQFLVPGSVSDKQASFAGQENVTGMNFHDRENGYLAGYLASLMTHGHQKVSAVAGTRTTAVRNLIAGFKAGAHHARSHIRVLVTYTGTYLNQGPCEIAANRQINQHSTVIFNAAGFCGYAALQAAMIRGGVWGLSDGPDLDYLGPRMLGSVTERTSQAIQLAVTLFADGQLPRGQDLQLNLSSGEIGLRPSNSVPVAIRAKIEQVDRRLRAHDDARPSR